MRDEGVIVCPEPLAALAGNGIMNVFHAPTGRHQLVVA